MAQIETNIEAKNGKGVGFERIRRITGYLVGTLWTASTTPSVPKSTTV